LREFDTGATRDTESGKLDYEGFLSPLTLKRYAEYMHSHRTQADGSLRDSDNWQKGIPIDAYMKSMFRHLMDLWHLHRGHVTEDNHGQVTTEDALCAIIFNASGYLHERLNEETEKEKIDEQCMDCTAPPCPVSSTEKTPYPCPHKELLHSPREEQN
jgi:hypothetical protein